MVTNPPKVFIVEDEEPIRTALQRLCRSAGYEGHVFASVDSFLSAETDDDNACIVADISMPGESGLEIPRRLREAKRSLPIIFVTAFDTGETRAQARAAGASAFFRKPVDDQALLDAIEWAVQGNKEMR